MSRVAPTQRLTSLDALRGFDMFWILGMEEFAEALGHASQAPWAQFISRQLTHVSWAGFHFLDLIFPLFVFIAGVSLVFSLSKSLAERGLSLTVRKLVVRAFVLYLLGLIYYGGIAGGLPGVRWVGVLQRIAVCVLVAGLLFCFATTRVRIATTVGILVLYWVMMCFVPIPGGRAGGTAEGPHNNLANWVDYQFLKGLRWDKTHDPEGLLSTLPAIATCLLGVLAGESLRREDVSPWIKVGGLLAAGAILLVSGWGWHIQFPVIKKLWTSSYVLVAGGYSCLLMGLAYGVIDVLGWKRWAAPWVWIGMNPIALYVAFKFVDYQGLAAAMVGGPIAEALAPFQSVWLSAWVVVLNIFVAWFLYSRKILIRV
jgi:predicted acyltransferase